MNERLNITKLDVRQTQTFAEDVLEGLRATPKRLPPKYLYDELGSVLFDAICLVPEYYPTRAEEEILNSYSTEIVGAAGAGNKEIKLLELGSGSASKTRRIIEALLSTQRELTFMPVDISLTALERSAQVLLQSYEQLKIKAFAGDYFTVLEHLQKRGVESLTNESERTLVLFLGSNIGNFDEHEAAAFLHSLRASLRAGDMVLLGADLRKEPEILEAAYDDALGVTAAFNLNLLQRINRELGGDFNLKKFRHVALYNQPRARVEMHIESLARHEVNVCESKITFEQRERLHTESSYKYDTATLAEMAHRAHFRCVQTWFDSEQRFSSNLWQAIEVDS